jgi:hypothetical protein
MHTYLHDFHWKKAGILSDFAPAKCQGNFIQQAHGSTYMPYYLFMLVLFYFWSQLHACPCIGTKLTTLLGAKLRLPGSVIYHTGSINNIGSSVEIQVILIRMGRRPVSVGLNSPKALLRQTIMLYVTISPYSP